MRVQQETNLLDCIVARWVDELRRHFGESLCSVCLYGSVARKDYQPVSDIDLLVVLHDSSTSYGDRADHSVHVHKKVQQSQEFKEAHEAKLPCQGNLLIYTVAELRRHPPVLLDMTIDGKIIYDPQRILENELDTLRARMKELGSNRIVMPDGAWYWILKPDIRFGEIFEL